MHILVVGAGKPLGARIAVDLAAEGHRVLATRRSSFGEDERLLAAGVELAELDVSDTIAVRMAAKDIDAAVLTPILSMAANAIAELAGAGVSRGVAFSSNNVAITPEDAVYRSLAAAEQQVMEAAPNWAILRPTMIYGHPGDGNFSRLLRHASKWPVLPVPGTAKALQQPIHIDDLVRLAAGLVTQRLALSGRLPVGGPDTLPQWDVVRIACRAAGSNCTPVQVPLAPLNAWVGLGLPSPVGAAQLARVELDKGAVGQPDLPHDFAPRVGIEAGLAALSAAMGLTPQGR